MVKFIPFDIERVWQNRLEQRCAKGWGDINRERLCGTARTLARCGCGVNRPINRASNMAYRELR